MQDIKKLQQTASEWHSGQWSPLYAFASTGRIDPQLGAEIRECLRDANKENASKLRAILKYIADKKPDQEPDNSAPIYSEPHQVLPGTTIEHIRRLLDRSDPYASGEVHRLAIGFRIATMETSAVDVDRRMRTFLTECEKRIEQ